MFDASEIDQSVLQSMEKLWPSYSTCESLTLQYLSFVHIPCD